MALLDELIAQIGELPPDQLEDLKTMTLEGTKNMRWVPTPGAQSDAYFCDADELFYGGSAGGGKSDLAVGLALTAHKKSLILRRYRDDARDLYNRVSDVVGTTDYGNKALLMQALPDRTIEFGGCKDEDDKQRYKGKPYDLYVFDEVSDFLKSQFEFIKTWNRSTVPGQRCRVVCTGNPPTTAEGLWVIDYWGPWLNPKHPNSAKEGELRWYTTDYDGNEIEVNGPGPHKIEKPDGTFDMVRARSRTFIRAWLRDNPFLSNTDYGANLDALPAQLRAAYRDGRFDLSLEDDIKQVIPTDWIRQAQDRWTKNPPDGVPMTAIGADVAQGGADRTVLSPRYGGWHAPLVCVPGKETPLGKDVFALIVKERRDNSHIVIDMGGGYGGAVYELCKDTEGMEKYTVAYKGAEGTAQRDKTKQFGFYNMRAYAYWYFRELLDPDQPGGSPIALPPDDNEMVADLTAAKFDIVRGKHGVPVIKITAKDKLVEELGRSPDKGDAIVMSHMGGLKPFMYNGPKSVAMRGNTLQSQANMGHGAKRRGGYGRKR